ncbi:Protoporphyrinogen oxidase [Auricularia subglabra TFB-10046 SS5]|nr:Protoporphyrinogen oxidase [Auricularia subglabra TFB-10046 SS5]
MAPSVAVLGGGISGLSAAFHLLRKFPRAEVTLFEGAPRTGGWLGNSYTMKTDNGTRLTLEAGPRTLRPKPELLELVVATGLAEAIQPVPSLPRFVHIPLPQYPGLTAVPNGFLSAVRSPLFHQGVRSIWRWVSAGDTLAPEPDEDEDLEQFLARTVDPELGRIGATAAAHGIYAADPRVLSARAVLGRLYEAGSPWDYVANIPIKTFSAMPRVTSGLTAPDGSSVTVLANAPFSLRGGTSMLPGAILATLKREPRFTLRHDHVSQLRGTTVVTPIGTSASFTRVVSALPLYTLRAVLPPDFLQRHRAAVEFLETPYANVTVVNLVFPADECPFPQGFGYLNARTDKDAPTPRVLGVVFDSSVAPSEIDANENLTRCTAMLSQPMALDELLLELGQHVGAKLPQPVFAKATQANRCIPTPTVGHVPRTRAFHEAIKSEWKGDLEVIGAAVAPGPGIGDCIEMAKGVGEGWTWALK